MAVSAYLISLLFGGGEFIDVLEVCVTLHHMSLCWDTCLIRLEVLSSQKCFDWVNHWRLPCSQPFEFCGLNAITNIIAVAGYHDVYDTLMPLTLAFIIYSSYAAQDINGEGGWANSNAIYPETQLGLLLPPFYHWQFESFWKSKSCIRQLLGHLKTIPNNILQLQIGLSVSGQREKQDCRRRKSGGW